MMTKRRLAKGDPGPLGIPEESRVRIRTVIPCGFCRTDAHEKCCVEIVWYEKVWCCSCETCHPAPEEVESTPEANA